MKAVAEECGLAALQFHGDETPEDLAQYRLPVIKTIKVDGPVALERIGRHPAAAFLLDSPARWSEGEARTPISWDVARAAAAAGHRIVLSAGLTPDNVADAMRAARPYAVDVDLGRGGAAGAQGRRQGAPLRGGGAGTRDDGRAASIPPRSPTPTATSAASAGASSPRR